MTGLTTDAKNLVEAINEVNSKITTGGVNIDWIGSST